MAAARLLRLAEGEEVAAWFAWALRPVPEWVSGQAPSSPAADPRKVEHRLEAQSLLKAWACRQSPVGAEVPRLARSSAAASARRWAASGALAAAVALRSGQTAALRAPEVAAAEALHAGAAEEAAALHAGVAAAEAEVQ
jgi:hypothetical protein